MAEHFRSLQLGEYVKTHLDKQTRPDGRRFNEFRDFLISSNCIQTASASALVKLGQTSVVCGITYNIIGHSNDIIYGDDGSRSSAQGASSSDQIRQKLHDLLQVQVKIPSYASYSLRMHQQKRDTTEGRENYILSAQLKRILLDTPVLNEHNFRIASDTLGEHWAQFNVELIVANFDGNALDACLFAVLVALRKLKLTSNEALASQQLPIQINYLPVSSTFAFLRTSDKKLVALADPTLDEQLMANGLLSIVVEPQQEEVILSYKEGGEPISAQLLIQLTDVAIKRANQVREKLSKL